MSSEDSQTQSQEDVDAIMQAAAGVADTTAPEAPSAPVIPGLTTKSGAEQRQTVRARAKFPYSLMAKAADGRDLKLSGYTEDISAGGCSITSSENIPPNSMVAIRIDMIFQGKPEPIVATARNVHQTFAAKAGGFRYGIQFVKISDDYKKAIEKYVKVFGNNSAV